MYYSVLHQPIPAAPSNFFALDGKFPGVGTLDLSNPPAGLALCFQPRFRPFV